MTVRELRTRLSKYPDDFKVVLDTSTDYEDYDEATHITPCEFSIEVVGVVVEKCSGLDANANAVLLT